MPIAAFLETVLLDSTNGALGDVSADKTSEKLELYSKGADIHLSHDSSPNVT